MRVHRISALIMLGAGIMAWPTGAPRSSGDVAQLAPLVGEWQSDTTGGTSAFSACAWTPGRQGILCEQRISREGRTTTAFNLFTPDSASGAFVLYVLSQPGAAMSPVSFTVSGHQWIYGGTTVAGDGRYYRTVNDFSQPGGYVWRQESSVDGRTWTAGVGGHVRRIR